MFEKLKKRWNIQSNFHVIIVLTVFAITGSATVYIKRLVFDLIGITSETHIILKVIIYIPAILIIYNILLLITGSLFGQFRFFWEFEKKFFSRLLFRKKQLPAEKINS